MRNLFSWLLLICLTAAPVLAADTIVEEIVARINNRIVTRTEFQHSMDDLKQEMQQQDAATAEKMFADHKKDVLRDLIDQQLLLDKGTEMSINGDTELIKKLDDMRKQMHLDTMEDLEKAAQSQGISFEDYKQNMRNQIITQQVIGKEVSSRLNVTKEEEQQFYDEHKKDMERPEEIRLSEILIAPQKKDDATPADDSQLAAAQAKADDVLAQIRKGGSFEEIAKKNSNGPTAAQGGDLGLFQRGMLAKELEDKTFAMKPGEVSDVVRTKQGFVILKVVEHRDGGLPPFKDIEPRVQEALYMQKLQPALRIYLLKLREDAFIKIADGYVDSGASPNETQFIETTTKDEKAKQLKKKRKIPLF